ncbi:hypothetical protein B0H21DRAFT_48959 [Amylocystis lapponica]|nr:hypothetical protein B0H21DRAFT_48959 [Amylocystis lapponica]
MVIDWHSRVPVMSDTLLPATLAQVQNPPSNVLPSAENDTQRYPAPAKQPTAWPKPAVEVIDVDAFDTSVVPNAAWTAVQRPTPPPSCRAGSASTPVNSSDPPSPRRLSRPLPRRPRPKVNPVAVDPVTDITSPSFNSTVDEHPEFYSSGANRGEASLVSLSKPNSVSAETDSQTSDPSASLGASALIPIPQTDAVALESAALVFLERFVLAFDADRATLAPAYSHCATISVRTPQEAGGLKQGRLAIAAALLALPDSLRFCAAGKAHIDYDVAYLGPQVGVLLVCYSHGHTTGQHKWSCEQALVLRRKEWDEEDRDTEGLWPLVAVCHRIHIRGSE